ncbi:MAG: hypothetical protein GWN00_28890 [Aliifodinibius sp.]|nr:hypothetical protein [Fodinibius sp.]NIX02096.1 hypothetical protein [Phycisphaerae bacterium]NIY28674.1 hypothetical protein [Fodinibius sp.]
MKSIIFLLLVFLSSTACASDDKVFGYLKKDINEELQKGDAISCYIKGDLCCVQTHEGEVCFNREIVSRTKIQKIDISLGNVKYFNGAPKDSQIRCEEGKSIAVEQDNFKWAYSFDIAVDNGDFNDDVIVELSLTPTYQDSEIAGASLSKFWIGKPGKCKVIYITKDDISSFLSKFRAYDEVLNIATDLNVYVDVKLILFSSREELRVDNNQVNSWSILPADSSAAWPYETK